MMLRQVNKSCAFGFYFGLVIPLSSFLVRQAQAQELDSLYQLESQCAQQSATHKAKNWLGDADIYYCLIDNYIYQAGGGLIARLGRQKLIPPSVIGYPGLVVGPYIRKYTLEDGDIVLYECSSAYAKCTSSVTKKVFAEKYNHPIESKQNLERLLQAKLITQKKDRIQQRLIGDWNVFTSNQLVYSFALANGDRSVSGGMEVNNFDGSCRRGLNKIMRSECFRLISWSWDSFDDRLSLNYELMAPMSGAMFNCALTIYLDEFVDSGSLRGSCDNKAEGGVKGEPSHWKKAS